MARLQSRSRRQPVAVAELPEQLEGRIADCLAGAIASTRRSRNVNCDRHFGCGTIRIYGFGDFQPCG